VLLSDEIAFVEDYLGVAGERYEGDLSFAYRGPEDLLSAQVPPLLLQPLVENSLKHGFSQERGAMRLVLNAEVRDGWLTLSFGDDGAAGAGGNGNGARGLGVGLENLEQRLRHFAGSDASMLAGPGKDGGFRVVMRWRRASSVMGAA
jgi:LytS/YehU family sensor histidine kinase